MPEGDNGLISAAFGVSGADVGLEVAADVVRIEAELLQEVVGTDQPRPRETWVGFDQVATARVGIDGKEPALRDDDGR